MIVAVTSGAAEGKGLTSLTEVSATVSLLHRSDEQVTHARKYFQKLSLNDIFQVDMILHGSYNEGTQTHLHSLHLLKHFPISSTKSLH